MPPELRAHVGKLELREPLGADRRAAIERLPLALVKINAVLDRARRILSAQHGASTRGAPTSVAELARTHYNHQLALDEVLRNSSSSWANTSIDDTYVHSLRAASAGGLTDKQLQDLLGEFIERYRLRGNITAPQGSTEWRQIARVLADAELQALARMYERDEGIFQQDVSHPAHLAPELHGGEEESSAGPLSMRHLLEQHLQRLEANGGGVSARKSWTRVFEDLLQFLCDRRGLRAAAKKQADDAHRLTAEEVIAWRDAKLQSLSPKTVKDVWLASLKAVLSDAVADRLLQANVAKGVRVRMYAAPVLREKGFTDQEALAILKRCREYEPPFRPNPANRESFHVTSAKRWGPWLCAFTGARVSEILQLRKEDVRSSNGIDYVHITPDAGTVKGKRYRDVPIHRQLIDIGFLDFVKASPGGPLFHSPSADLKKLPAQAVSGRVAKWLQSEKLIPDGVQPNHGWRHRFKTLSREAGLDPHVVDSIQGHSGRTASDGYGDVTLITKKTAVERLACYDVLSSDPGQ